MSGFDIIRQNDAIVAVLIFSWLTLVTLLVEIRAHHDFRSKKPKSRKSETGRRQQNAYTEQQKQQKSGAWNTEWDAGYSGPKQEQTGPSTKAASENPFNGLSRAEAARRYKSMVKECHPDNSGNEDDMAKLNIWYQEYREELGG